MDENNLEGKVRRNARGILKAAAIYAGLGVFALATMGSDCESECCQQLNCGSRYVCAGSGPFGSEYTCITNSEGHEECCGCVLEGREPR